MTNAEFEAIIGDDSKVIDGDLEWSKDVDHSPCVEFRADVGSEDGYPIFVCGSYNPIALKLSFSLIHRGHGRIYGLDLGSEHHNPSCDYVGECHKHRWNEIHRDKEAYVPQDLTAEVDDPVAVWEQFCAESKIQHHGHLASLPASQSSYLS